MTPSSAQPTSLAPGLLARATDGERTVVFVTPTPNFTLTPYQSIHPQLRAQFTAEWTGLLNVVRAGRYTINGEGRIWVNVQEVANQPVQLEAGPLPLRVTFERTEGGMARLQLRWESEFFKPEPVPASAFSHREDAAAHAAADSLARGRELAEELNCQACHTVEGAGAAAALVRGSRRGPDLTGLGGRTTANWIFKWLENPRAFQPAAVEPVLLNNAQERADVAAYLAGLKDADKKIEETPTSEERQQRGNELFETIGCTACHSDANTPLKGRGAKWTAGGLREYLRNLLAHDPSGRMPGMALTKDEAGCIAEHLVKSKNAEFEAAAPAGDAARGRQLAQGRGCLNCHALKDGGAALASTLSAAPFHKLAARKGCLAEEPSSRAARYALTAEDRAALAAFVQGPDVSDAPVQDFARLIKKFQCVSCHEYNGPAKVAFEKLPPPLSEAGHKLRASWLEQVLCGSKRVRPWMALRMPNFGPDALRPLLHAFAAQVGAELGEGELIAPAPDPQVQSGIKLIGRGEGGLSCISCHDYRGEKSAGDQRGPDMTEMYARVRADWFRRWLREPGRVISGTAMPAFFLDMDETEANQKIEALLAAVSKGKDMPIPEGLADAALAYMLLVKDEPIVFRTFIQDSSPRSIAVGLPGGQNFVFDASSCRLSYAWSGDFLDVKPVWADRGGSQARILGQRYYTAPDLFPLRFGNPDAEPKVQFKGYRLIKKLPEFMFEVDGVPVRETIEKAPAGDGLVCRFAIDAPKGDVWFVAGETPNVTVTSAAGAFANGRLRIAPRKDLRFEVVNVTN
ncbi:MAG: c-type cytochrome [Verrucomicrobia bacterium]|nr:c-type cytochrome [Verrucomicrobiota bacterium]